MNNTYQITQQHLREQQYTWLITGVAGFIGSNLLETLLKLNQKVIGLDNFITGYQHNIDAAIADANNPDADFHFIQGSIEDAKTCQQACQGVDFVLHQAALGSVPRSIEEPLTTNATNIDGFLNMLVAARDNQVKRFVYAASSSTYGDHPDLPKQEDKIGNPLSPYAVTKLVNELYAQVFARTYDFHSIGLRYFNIFGKRQDPQGAYAAVIPKWVAEIMQGKQVFINGDGTTSRDFCYIENTVQMNILAAMTKDKAAVNQVYNVAVGDRTDLNELFDTIQQALCALNPAIKQQTPIHRDFRIGDVKHSQADISKAQNLLGYQPEYAIDTGLQAAMQWYSQKLG